MANPYRIWTSCQLSFDRSLYKRRQASLGVPTAAPLARCTSSNASLRSFTAGMAGWRCCLPVFALCSYFPPPALIAVSRLLYILHFNFARFLSFYWFLYWVYVQYQIVQICFDSCMWNIFFSS